MINGNGSRNSSNGASNSKWTKCRRSTLNSHKSCKSASSETCKNKRRNNLRVNGPQHTSNHNAIRRAGPHWVRPSIQSRLKLWRVPCNFTGYLHASDRSERAVVATSKFVVGNQACVAVEPARKSVLDRQSVLFAVFHQILQCAVPQSAEFTIQKMRATEERQDGIAAVLHFAAGLSQSCIFTE